MSASVHRILIIRRDNIGDLVCTTPMIAALRRVMPDAWIGVLVNQYNVAVMCGNPDVNDVFAYRKAKHRGPGVSKLGIWLETARLLWRLRRMKLDFVLCASPGAQRFARLLAPRRIIETDRSGSEHEVAITSRLLAPMGVIEKPGPLVLHENAEQQAQLLIRLGLTTDRSNRCVAVHLSARKPRQRWPLNYHAEFIRRLLADGLADKILLFWAPGDESDPQHPGDDRKAEQLITQLRDLAVTPVPTHELSELVAGLSLANIVICSDGGAMHIAAALGKPILCFFGNSSAERWHPWGVFYELLQNPSRNVADINVDEAYTAFKRLTGRLDKQ